MQNAWAQAGASFDETLYFVLRPISASLDEPHCCFMLYTVNAKSKAHPIDQVLAKVDRVIPNIPDPLPSVLATIVFTPVLHHHVGNDVYRDGEDHLVVQSPSSS